MIELHTPRRFLPVKTGRLIASKKLALPSENDIKKAEGKQRDEHMRDGTARRLNNLGHFDHGPATGGAYWTTFTKSERQRLRIT